MVTINYNQGSNTAYTAAAAAAAAAATTVEDLYRLNEVCIFRFFKFQNSQVQAGFKCENRLIPQPNNSMLRNKVIHHRTPSSLQASIF